MIFSVNMEQRMYDFNKMVEQPTHRSLGILREMFPRHVVSLRFFLWGYLKAQVYQYRPQTLESLKEAITQEVAVILPEMFRRVMRK
jgi:hypothetical protein